MEGAAVGLLEKGTNWLNTVFQTSESVEVRYSRGEQVVFVRATRGQTEVPMVDANGLACTFQAADFLIAAETIDFGAGVVEPKPDDQILDGGRIYRVQRVPGADCFRYSDPDRTVVRVHAKYWKAAA